MYILVKPDQSTFYPYSIRHLMSDNPYTSFRTDMSDDELAQWGVYPVSATPRPQYDKRSQEVVEFPPLLVNNVWTQVWQVQPLSDAEIQELINISQKNTNDSHREYLASTDWYVIRKSETGIEIPEEILIARIMARRAIIEIE